MDKETLKLLVEKAPDLNQVYSDVAQPAFRKLGLALETVFDLCNNGLLPIRLLNARSNLYFDKAMKQLAKEYENVDEQEIIQVRPEIGVPILERLTYTTTEEIRNLYISLLKSASLIKNMKYTHPVFLKVIESISADEAKIIKHLYSKKSLPVIRHRLQFKDNPSTYLTITTHTTELEFDTGIGIFFPENCGLYLENLEGLGLIKLDYTKSISDSEKYDSLNSVAYDTFVNDAIADNFNAEIHSEIRLERGILSISELGHTFGSACIIGE
ncbi:DUF4393 domain-containing protein [Cohnella sp.]|uniref:DUF4393 domain-containing protein n=1 Tax=Cohnella sp. TaxID=1883426 RepID=UPI0035691E64